MPALFPSDAFVAAVRPLCVRLVLSAFQRRPRFVDLLTRPIMRAIACDELTPSSADLAVNMAWAVGEYGALETTTSLPKTSPSSSTSTTTTAAAAAAAAASSASVARPSAAHAASHASQPAAPSSPAAPCSEPLLTPPASVAPSDETEHTARASPSPPASPALEPPAQPQPVDDAPQLFETLEVILMERLHGREDRRDGGDAHLLCTLLTAMAKVRGKDIHRHNVTTPRASPGQTYLRGLSLSTRQKVPVRRKPRSSQELGVNPPHGRSKHR